MAEPDQSTIQSLEEADFFLKYIQAGQVLTTAVQQINSLEGLTLDDFLRKIADQQQTIYPFRV